MLFDESSIPDNDGDLTEALTNARVRLRRWRNRSLYSMAALLLSGAAIYPFSLGHALHAYSEPYGRYFVFLSMFLLLVSVYSTGLLWSAWRCLRDLEQGRT
jgi:hypothetical protein